MESYRSHGSFGTQLFSVNFFVVDWSISSSHSSGLKTYWSTSHNLGISIFNESKKVIEKNVKKMNIIIEIYFLSNHQVFKDLKLIIS